MLRRSLDEGFIPEIFKMAYISPIHKGGSKQDPERYRPVSLTSHIAKVFERVVKKKIEKYLVDNAKLNKGQHGSVQGRSTQTELLAHYNDIYDAISEGKRIDTVYLDFAKAFDKVDHKILLQKVRNHGIGGKIGRWIEEFLKDRKFRVVVNGCMSDEAKVLSGVPQGTVLAALLFVIMISDIDENIKKSIVRSFVDDTRVNRKINGPNDKKELQEHLNMMYKWARENKMEFNESKFEHMSSGNSNEFPLDHYKTPSGDEIQTKDTVRDLGVITSKNLDFKEHINKITTDCLVVMGMLLRAFETRAKGPMIMLYNTFLRSKLEYCCLVWSPREQQDINKIEDIQRIFTKKIDGMKDLNYHERLKKLNMYSLERRRDRYKIIYAWQQIEGLKENIMNLKTNKNKTNRMINNGSYIKRGTRSTTSALSKIHYSPLRTTERAFNSLPRKLRNMTGVKVDTFKNHLDSWMMQIPDLPKCSGYSYVA